MARAGPRDYPRGRAQLQICRHRPSRRVSRLSGVSFGQRPRAAGSHPRNGAVRERIDDALASPRAAHAGLPGARTVPQWPFDSPPPREGIV
jgi:hypothetical protein